MATELVILSQVYALAIMVGKEPTVQANLIAWQLVIPRDSPQTEPSTSTSPTLREFQLVTLLSLSFLLPKAWTFMYHQEQTVTQMKLTTI